MTASKASTSNASSILPDLLPLPAPPFALRPSPFALRLQHCHPLAARKCQGISEQHSLPRYFLKNKTTHTSIRVRKIQFSAMPAETFGQIKTAPMLSPRLATTTGAMVLYVERGWEGTIQQRAHEVSGIVEVEACKECDWYRDFYTCKYSTTGEEPHLCSSYCSHHSIYSFKPAAFS